MSQSGCITIIFQLVQYAESWVLAMIQAVNMGTLVYVPG
jgi:hypothetical protein